MANATDGPRVVVFAGPSLEAEDRLLLPRATFLPPAEQGSFVSAVTAFAPQAIVLIDGSFGRVPAVRHKEILWTLAQGIPVFGAGSMGALRAADLAGYGMVGFGLIYRWYRRVPLLDDDEVAVATTPPELGAEPLGEALVNIRLTLRRCERAGILASVTRKRLEAVAESIYFVDRSYERLLSEARETLPAEDHSALDLLARELPTHVVDQKRRDAVGLLRRLGTTPPTPMHAAPFILTEAWAYDLAEADEAARA